jgi:chromosome segregation protein
VAEILETIRRRRDDVGQDARKFDELRAVVEHLAAHGERQMTVSQSLRASADAIRSEVERMQRDLLRTNDGVKIVEQEGRRRVAEIAQHIENLGVQYLDASGRYERLQAQIDELREAGENIDPQFQGLGQAISRLEDEVARFQTQSAERDDIMAERIEAVRQQLDTDIRDVRQTTDERFDRMVQRVDQLDEVDRELAYRINLLEMQIDELRQIDRRVRREIW